MLFTYRALDRIERLVLDQVAQMRHELRYEVVQEPRRWTGLLARMTRAKALRESNSVEGINISAEDAIAAIDGEDPTDADRPTWRSIVGYQTAMEFILHRCRDPNFHFSEETILTIHFMICQHDLSANPGNYRRGWVGVRNSASGEVVHEGIERDQLTARIDELVDYLNDKNVESQLLKAAMAHLNLTLLHPFSDGNGRTARCLQTAVLAKEGIAAPEFFSIEEYIGRNQQEYYDTLAITGGGGWNPGRDCKPWIRFCITGHYRQARTLLRRSREMSQVYGELVSETSKHKLHERTALALLEAAAPSRIRNSSYRISADISNNLASRDLKDLVEVGLLVPKGERRGRHYIASDAVMKIRDRNRLPRGINDPFKELSESNLDQASLF